MAGPAARRPRRAAVSAAAAACAAACSPPAVSVGPPVPHRSSSASWPPMPTRGDPSARVELHFGRAVELVAAGARSRPARGPVDPLASWQLLLDVGQLACVAQPSRGPAKRPATRRSHRAPKRRRPLLRAPVIRARSGAGRPRRRATPPARARRPRRDPRARRRDLSPGSGAGLPGRAASHRGPGSPSARHRRSLVAVAGPRCQRRFARNERRRCTAGSRAATAGVLAAEVDERADSASSPAGGRRPSTQARCGRRQDAGGTSPRRSQGVRSASSTLAGLRAKAAAGVNGAVSSSTASTMICPLVSPVSRSSARRRAPGSGRRRSRDRPRSLRRACYRSEGRTAFDLVEVVSGHNVTMRAGRRRPERHRAVGRSSPASLVGGEHPLWSSHTLKRNVSSGASTRNGRKSMCGTPGDARTGCAATRSGRGRRTSMRWSRWAWRRSRRRPRTS